MKKPRLDWVLAVLMSVSAAAVGACGGDDAAGDDDGTGDHTPGTPDAGDPGGPDADLGDWLVLNQGEWTLQPGEERYFCIVETITQETDIRAFKGLLPPGTHHTVLTLYSGNLPDGIAECDAGTNGQSMIYGTGVGTPEMELPAGVAIKLKAGQKILNNLHLYNATDQVMTGTSGTLYKPFQGTPEHLAELVLTGPIGFSLDNSASQTTQMLHAKGGCTIQNITKEPIFVFAMNAHMHKRGRHMVSTLVRGGQSTVVFDSAYDFDSQVFTMQSPFLELKPGDVLKSDCTFEMAPGEKVGFGDSSDDEMCFTDIFYFPAQGANFICPF